MKNQLLFLLFLLFPFLGHSQISTKFGRNYSDSLPENFRLSTTALRDHIYNGIPAQLKNELKPRNAYRFADLSAVELSMSFSSGIVYSDWPALELYINNVLQKIVPQELAKDSVIHSYLIKDGSFNASMWPFGIFFVNIGLLDDIPTEAALASVFAHELAHYYLKHALNGFAKEEHGDFERVFSKSNRSKFSINNELQADSLAIAWLNQSGYGLQGMRDLFVCNQRIEKRNLLQTEGPVNIKETTHPFSERRLIQVDSFAKTDKAKTGVDFIVSQKQFYKFKEAAKSEILKLLLYDLEYDACIEKAFKFHILNPEKAEYVYYLMEGIRRKCYFDNDAWSQNFLTGPYYKIIENALGPKKIKHRESVFKEIPMEILCLSDIDTSNMKARFYWEGVPKFTTYLEAFDFFGEVGKLYKEPECILSTALSLNFDKKTQNQLLTNYLSFENIQFRSYATNLLNGTIQTALPPKILTVLGNIYVTVRHGKEEIYIRNEKLVEDNKFEPILKEVLMDFPQRQFLNLASLQINKISDFVMLRELRKLTLIPLFAKGERTNLHIIDPRYWEMMEKYKVNEIEFIDLSYYDARKAAYDLESYVETIKSDFVELMTETKRNRYVMTRVYSIREIPDNSLKIKHYGQEEKLSYNEPVQKELIDYLKRNIQDKDKLAKK
jgi:hypothetical protein